MNMKSFVKYIVRLAKKLQIKESSIPVKFNYYIGAYDTVKAPKFTTTHF